MATQFIKYENALLELEGTTILADSATLGLEVSLEPITDVTGAVSRYAQQGPIRGTLSFDHYCTGTFHDFLNPITAIEHTGEPLQGSLGGVTFQSGYVKSLSFSVQPFQPIVFSSEIDIYGELTALHDRGDEDAARKLLPSYPEDVQISHALRSYLAGDDIGISNQVSFSYSASAERNPVVTIGNELPYRVTKENVRIQMGIQGEDFGNILKITGNNAALRIQVYDVYGNSALAEFGCTGQIHSNELSVSSNGFMQGGLSLSQEYLTGKAVV